MLCAYNLHCWQFMKVGLNYNCFLTFQEPTGFSYNSIYYQNQLTDHQDELDELIIHLMNLASVNLLFTHASVME